MGGFGGLVPESTNFMAENGSRCREENLSSLLKFKSQK